VILAFRISEIAAPDEILVSAAVRASDDFPPEVTVAAPRPVELKGIAEPQLVHPVLWRPDPP
jgi:class 3 adenylate cyclase